MNQAVWGAVAAVQDDHAWDRVEQAATTAREEFLIARDTGYALANRLRVEIQPQLLANCFGPHDPSEVKEAMALWMANEGQGRSLDDPDADDLRLGVMMEGVEQVIGTLETLPMAMVWLDLYGCMTQPGLCHIGKSVDEIELLMSALSRTTL